jgi:hypothetical protein
LLGLVGRLLTFQLAFKAYDSAVPLATFKATLWIGLVISLVFSVLMYTVMSGLLLSFYPECVAAFRTAARKVCGLDAAVATCFAVGVIVLLNKFQTALMDRFRAQALYGFGAPDLIVSAVPAVSVIAAALSSVLTYAAALAVIVQILGMLPKRWMAIPAGLLAAAALAPSDVRTPGEFALQYGMALIGLCCAAMFCLFFARRNYLAYAVSLLTVACLRNGTMQLLGQPNPWLQLQGWIVIAVLVCALVWAVLPTVSRAPEAIAATGTN